MPGKDVSAQAFIGFIASVDLGMTFEIVSTHKALVTVIAFVLAVTKVGLDVRFYIFFPSKPSVATGMQADPFSILVRS